jgi:hypothetical protein
MKKFAVLMLLALVPVVACEAIADFDRTKIPTDATDSGSAADVVLPTLDATADAKPVQDAAKLDSATPDAASDAADGGSDAGADAP